MSSRPLEDVTSSSPPGTSRNWEEVLLRTPPDARQFSLQSSHSSSDDSEIIQQDKPEIIDLASPSEPSDDEIEEALPPSHTSLFAVYTTTDTPDQTSQPDNTTTIKFLEFGTLRCLLNTESWFTLRVPLGSLEPRSILVGHDKDADIRLSGTGVRKSEMRSTPAASRA